MDTNLRELWRGYSVSGDTQAVAAFCVASLRGDLIHQIENNVDNVAAAVADPHSLQRTDTWLLWSAWNTGQGHLTTVFSVLQSHLPDIAPRKQLLFRSRSEYNQYVRRWEDYFNRNSGNILLIKCDSYYNPGSESWDHTAELVTTLPLCGMDNVHNVLNHYAFFSDTSNIVLLSLFDRYQIDLDYDQLGKMPTAENVIYEACEDYPCCGHDVCPPRWDTGETAAIVCICGKLLPANSRSSLCDNCLFGPRRARVSQEDLENMDDEDRDDYLDSFLEDDYHTYEDDWY